MCLRAWLVDISGRSRPSFLRACLTPVRGRAMSPNTWWSWAIACSAGTLLAASPAAAQCQYEVTVIRAPDVCGILGPVLTFGIGLNENGAVVGSWKCPVSEGALRAVLKPYELPHLQSIRVKDIHQRQPEEWEYLTGAQYVPDNKAPDE